MTFVPARSTFSLTRKTLALLLCATVIAAALSVALVRRADAAADSCTWTGAASTDLVAAGNWTGCDNTHTPENGDTLIFPSSASNKAISINNATALRPGQMNITGTGYSFTRTGSEVLTFTGSGVFIDASEDVSFNVPVAFGDGTLENMTVRAATDKQINFNSPVVFDTGAGEINAGGTGKAGNVVFAGAVTGTTSQLIAIQGASLFITGSGNTYTAATVGAETTGAFYCDAVSCFGNAANQIYMGGGGVAIRVAGTYTNPVVTSSPQSEINQLNAFDNVTLSGNVQLNDSARFSESNNPGKTLTLSGTITTTAGHYLGFFGDTADDATIAVSGKITGTASSIQTNNVYLRLTNNTNDFISPVSVGEGGILSVQAEHALGNAANTVTVDDGGMVELASSGDVTIEQDFTIDGSGISGRGAIDLVSLHDAEIAGDVILAGASSIGNETGDNVLGFSGVISGTGNLTVVGAPHGAIFFEGPDANTYSGTTYVNGPDLVLAKNDNVIAVPGDVTVTGDSADPVLLVPLGTEQFEQGSIVTLNGPDDGASFLMPVGGSQTVGTIEGDGTIIFEDDSDVLNVGSGNVSGTFSGAVAGTGTVHKIGTGTWNIDGVVGAHGGDWPTFVIDAGKFLANFSDEASENSPFTVDGGKLGGSSIIGSLTVSSGHVAPGNSPGCVNPTGAFTLSSSATVDVELNGTTPCTGYDKITATGAVTLGGADLTIALGYAPAPGTVFTIVEGASISGTFGDHADGSVVTIGSTSLRLNYTATAVTLTVVANPVTGSLPATGTAPGAPIMTALMLIVAGAILARRKKFIAA